MQAKYSIPTGKELRIAISGRSGCGNTTVSKLLSDVLGIGFINFTFRSLAAETGIPLPEIIERAKTDDSFDRAVDSRQVELARQASCVMGSRLAVWMLKEADLKVFLTAPAAVRAERIRNREGGDLEEIMRFTAMRDSEDSRRYRELYDIDNTDYGFCDLVIETEKNNPEQIVSLILESACQKGLLLRA